MKSAVHLTHQRGDGPDASPNLSPDQVTERTHGGLLQTPLPSYLSKEDITSFKLIVDGVDGHKLGEGRDEIFQDISGIPAVKPHVPGANAFVVASGFDTKDIGPTTKKIQFNLVSINAQNKPSMKELGTT
ncbi:hypothetical protein PMIN06_012750 [Paraphaeosphaeria minitans]